MGGLCLQDKSWRVRYNVAAQMVPLCEALGPEMTRAELVPAYTKLLEDTEAEVRIAAAGKVSAFSRMLTPQLIVSQVSTRRCHDLCVLFVMQSGVVAVCDNMHMTISGKQH